MQDIVQTVLQKMGNVSKPAPDLGERTGGR